MTDIEREELIGAYLDGELSPEERARVESWLAENSELRQLHDDLIALRAGMQVLPRHKLDHDLAATVMHKAQLAVANSKENSARKHAAGNGAILPGSTNWWDRGSNVRRLLWPALAVAAALAILIYDANQRPEEQQVAQAPAASGEVESQVGALNEVDQKIGAAPETTASPLAGAPAPAAPMAEDRNYPRPESSQVTPAESATANRAARSRSLADGSPASAESRDAAPESASVSSRGVPNAAAPMAKANGALYSQVPVGAKAAAQPTIICPVSIEYFRDNSFEALLKSKGITWERLPVAPGKSLAKEELGRSKLLPYDTLGAHPEQTLYLLRANTAQVNEVLAEVPQSPKLAEGNQTVLPRFTDAQQRVAGEADPGVQVLLVAPQQAAPAAPPQPNR